MTSSEVPFRSHAQPPIRLRDLLAGLCNCGFNSLKQLARLISTNSVSAAVLELNFDSIESRHVIQPATADPPNPPAVVPAIAYSSCGFDIVNEELSLNEADTE